MWETKDHIGLGRNERIIRQAIAICEGVHPSNSRFGCKRMKLHRPAFPLKLSRGDSRQQLTAGIGDCLVSLLQGHLVSSRPSLALPWSWKTSEAPTGKQ